MNILLDTHLILWGIYSPDKLPKKAMSIMKDRSNLFFCSFVSAWEIAIKHCKHPGRFPFTAGELIRECRRAGIMMMELKGGHITSYEELVCCGIHHKDPFDNMLVAQAREENMILLTHDAKMKKYEDPGIILV